MKRQIAQDFLNEMECTMLKWFNVQYLQLLTFFPPSYSFKSCIFVRHLGADTHTHKCVSFQETRRARDFIHPHEEIYP